MQILYVTNKENKNIEIPNFLLSEGEQVEIITKNFSVDFLKEKKINFIITNKSRFLIKEDIINYIGKNIINVHNSYLPWCRGYNSNFWSIYFNLPNGVTIHYIDKDIDSGDILAQNTIRYNLDDTLKSTYDKLDILALDLFKKNWKNIKEKKIKSFNQRELDLKNFNISTYNKDVLKYAFKTFYKNDFLSIYQKLPRGWDTKVKDVRKIEIKLT